MALTTTHLSTTTPPVERVIIHCPQRGSSTAVDFEPGEWEQFINGKREEGQGAQNWWSTLRKLAPTITETGEDIAEFSKDYLRCKKLRGAHDWVDHEWSALLSFGASAQTRSRWPYAGDQPSLLVGATQTGSIVLSAAGLLGGMKSIWTVIRNQ